VRAGGWIVKDLMSCLAIQQQEGDPWVVVSQLLDLIPPINLRLLASLMKHLNFVSTFKDKNRMDAANLAIVWGPILLRPRVETMETVLADVSFVNSFIAFIIQQPDYFFKRKLAKLDKGEKKEDRQGTS